MKAAKQIFAACIALLGLFLASCECEDIYLGEIELNGTLDSFVPAIEKEENLTVLFNNKVGNLGYRTSRDTFLETVPVEKAGKRTHGKGAVSDCVEYYNAQNKWIGAYSNTNPLPLDISILLTKNYKPQGYSEIENKESVDDVVHFSLVYETNFPVAVTKGSNTYNSYKTVRTFAFSLNPDKLVYKPHDVKQEYFSSINLDGVQHEKVYHLYLASPQFSEDEAYFNGFYPLSYIQGIYIKEGFGLIRAYTSTNQKIDFRSR
ncbi:hypothetical protein ACFSRY_06465 [Pontibacter locisalis]|uniref:Uncharacterized protein n=1 Tax=Pontibacter locisalis TaxID=1719035 RepID=A0ABW5IIN0_9BACT